MLVIIFFVYNRYMLANKTLSPLYDNNRNTLYIFLYNDNGGIDYVLYFRTLTYKDWSVKKFVKMVSGLKQNSYEHFERTQTTKVKKKRMIQTAMLPNYLQSTLQKSTSSQTE